MAWRGCTVEGTPSMLIERAPHNISHSCFSQMSDSFNRHGHPKIIYACGVLGHYEQPLHPKKGHWALRRRSAAAAPWGRSPPGRSGPWAFSAFGCEHSSTWCEYKQTIMSGTFRTYSFVIMIYLDPFPRAPSI